MHANYTIIFFLGPYRAVPYERQQLQAATVQTTRVLIVSTAADPGANFRYEPQWKGNQPIKRQSVTGARSLMEEEKEKKKLLTVAFPVQHNLFPFRPLHSYSHRGEKPMLRVLRLDLVNSHSFRVERVLAC